MPGYVPTVEDTYEWVNEKKAGCMQLDLPTDFAVYWKAVNKDVRTQYRKAQRNGITSKWTTEVARGDIAEIWNSWEGKTKQGRPLERRMVHFNPVAGIRTVEDWWPWAYYLETEGYIDLIQAYDKNGIVVGYLELASTPKEAVVMSTLGHYDFLSLGVMKMIFVEAVQGLIARTRRYFYYTNKKKETVFARNLGFTC